MRKSLLYSLPLLGLLCIAGCPKDDTETPDDTSPEGDTDTDTDADTDTDTDTDADTDTDTDTDTDVDVRITAVSYSYDASRWMYTVENNGGVVLAKISIIQERGERNITERHNLNLNDEAPNGAWQVWGANLTIVEQGKSEPGRSTAFEGTEITANALTWMATLQGDAGTEDCVVWGFHPMLFDKYSCRAIIPNN